MIIKNWTKNKNNVLVILINSNIEQNRLVDLYVVVDIYNINTSTVFRRIVLGKHCLQLYDDYPKYYLRMDKEDLIFVLC